MPALKFTLLVFLLFCSLSLLAQPGTPDPAFGKAGIVTTNVYPSYDQAFDIIRRPDGRLLVVGSAEYGPKNAFAAVQLLPDGSADRTFDFDGKMVNNLFSREEIAYSVALYPDGRAILAGIAENAQGNFDFALMRITADGLPDNSFGDKGRVFTDFSQDNDHGDVVLLQADEKIIVAGTTTPDGFESDFALARYLPNGTLDSTFGINGKVIQPIGAFSEAVFDAFLQPDGKIVVAGNVYDFSFDADYAIARYLPDGTLDYSFGDKGIVVFDFDAPYDLCTAITLQPDGKIVAAGIYSKDFLSQVSALRLLPNGTVDSTFGNNGTVLVPVGDYGVYCTDVQIQPDGKLLLSGMVEDVDYRDFFVLRLQSNGALDPSFGNAGITITSGSDKDDNSYAMALKPNGGFVLVGKSYAPNKTTDLSILQYTAAGALDPFFENGGIVQIDNGSSEENAYMMLVQADGKIVVHASAKPGRWTSIKGQEVGFLRYYPNGTLDSTFNSTGIALRQFSTGYNFPDGFTVLKNGAYVGAGHINDQAALWKFEATGALSTNFGIGGKVLRPPQNGAAYTAVAEQADGRIIAVGRNDYPGGGKDLLQRYFDNGAPDTSLQINNLITNLVGAEYGQWEQIVLTPDQKILLLGLFRTHSGIDRYGVLARFNASGALDTSFAEQGILKTTIDLPMRINCFELLPDNSILLGGSSNYNQDYAVGKLDKNGHWDTSFGNNGLAFWDFGQFNNSVNDLAVQADGRIIIVGRNSMPRNNLGIMRLNPDGSLDESFVPNGTLSNFWAGPGTSVEIEPSGSILVMPVLVEQWPHDDILLVRLLTGTALGIADQADNSPILLVYPNPVKESLNLEYELLHSQTIRINLYDQAGRLAGNLLQNAARAAGKHQETLELPMQLPAGVYTLVLETATTKRAIQIIK